MEPITNQADDIQVIFKTQIKIESKVMAIEALFANERRARKTDYKPFYQRNYVWDYDKATYFIESILLGTEIPPIIFFNSEEKIEVIDGRQRYETIKRFIGKEFKLKKKGLLKLKDFKNKNFDDLNELKDTFWETKLRVIEFSFRDPSLATPEKEDIVKKEIFKRYNSGITPLREVEIDKAKYQDNPVNEYFKNRISKNELIQKSISEVFYFDLPFDIEKVLKKIRQQLVLPYVPIKYYANLSTKQDIIDRFFEYLSETTSDIKETYISFLNKLEILNEIKTYLSKNNIITNRLMYECLFWGMSIIEKEEININIIKEKKSKDTIIQHFQDLHESYRILDSNFPQQTIERYTAISSLFEKLFDFKFNNYIFNNTDFKEKNKELSQIGSDNISRFESLRLNKPEPSSSTIYDICQRLAKEKFLVRPPYQRKEVIDRFKSSAIIESILLGIKLPPIFLYKRNDGIVEVLDGQQRLLSVIGYLGVSFMDENKRFVYSQKNNYSLRRLNILKDIDGKKFSELSQSYQDRIEDYDLWIIEISERNNPDFDPIDLFIRLNYKPFPILENTFEMWNSYLDRDIINRIKSMHEKYKKWFYVRVDNRRMENESLLTYLSFLEFKTSFLNDRREAPSNLDIYKSSKLNVRITTKSEITSLLDKPSNKSKFIESCDSLENVFMVKLMTLLATNKAETSDETTDYDLDIILGISKRRTFQNFYVLWYILLNISLEAIEADKENIRLAINKIIREIKNYKDVESFKKDIESFQNKYQSEK